MSAAALQTLLTQSNLRAFFKTWPQTIHPSSPLNASFRALQADYHAALDAFIQGNAPDDGSRAIVTRAFALLDRVTPADLEERVGEEAEVPPATTGAPAGADAELARLIEEKLAFLKRSRLLAIDPSAQFALDKQIGELEGQLRELLG